MRSHRTCASPTATSSSSRSSCARRRAPRGASRHSAESADGFTSGSGTDGKLVREIADSYGAARAARSRCSPPRGSHGAGVRGGGRVRRAPAGGGGHGPVRATRRGRSSGEALDLRAAYHDCPPRPSWAEFARRWRRAVRGTGPSPAHHARDASLRAAPVAAEALPGHSWRSGVRCRARGREPRRRARGGGHSAACGRRLLLARLLAMAVKKRSLSLGRALGRGLGRARRLDRARVRARAAGGRVRIQGVVDNNVYPPLMGHTARVWNLYKGPRTAGRASSARAHRVRDQVARARDGARGARRVSIVRVKPLAPDRCSRGSRRRSSHRCSSRPRATAASRGRSPRLGPGGGRARDRQPPPHPAPRARAARCAARVRLAERRGGVVRARRPESHAARALGRAARGARAARPCGGRSRVAVSTADKDEFVARYGTPPAEDRRRRQRLRRARDCASRRPSEKQGARDALGLAAGEQGLLFVGTGRRAQPARGRGPVPPSSCRVSGRSDARLSIVGDVSEAFRAPRASEGDGRVQAAPDAERSHALSVGLGRRVEPGHDGGGIEREAADLSRRGPRRADHAVRRARLRRARVARSRSPRSTTSPRHSRVPFPSRPGRHEALAGYAWQEQAAAAATRRTLARGGAQPMKIARGAQVLLAEGRCGDLRARGRAAARRRPATR